jgi:hypothetical protein
MRKKTSKMEANRKKLTEALNSVGISLVDDIPKQEEFQIMCDKFFTYGLNFQRKILNVKGDITIL